MAAETKKELISEGEIDGGLKDCTQVYKINYLYPTEEYSEKVEIALIVKKKVEGKDVESYRSLRFVSAAQLISFIIGVIKAYIFFLKQKGSLRPDNFNYKLSKFSENINEVWRNPEVYA